MNEECEQLKVDILLFMAWAFMRSQLGSMKVISLFEQRIVTWEELEKLIDQWLSEKVVYKCPYCSSENIHPIIIVETHDWKCGDCGNNFVPVWRK